jgi:hypothetical protein
LFVSRIPEHPERRRTPKQRATTFLIQSSRKRRFKGWYAHLRASSNNYSARARLKRLTKLLIDFGNPALLKVYDHTNDGLKRGTTAILQ